MMWSEHFFKAAERLDRMTEKYESRGDKEDADSMRKLAHGNRAMAHMMLFYGSDSDMCQ